MHHVFNQNNLHFSSFSFYLHFSSQKSYSQLIFMFSFQNLYLHNDFNQKIVHTGLTTQKNKVKIPCLSTVNQLLRGLLMHKPPEKLSIFSLLSVSNSSKNNINKFFVKKASKVDIKTTYDININQILLLNIQQSSLTSTSMSCHAA